VDIHVHGPEAEGDIQNAGGKAPGEQRVSVSLLDGGLQELRFNVPPVAEKILQGAVSPSRGGGGYEAGNGNAAVANGNRQQAGRRLAA
jgi:hypothetical protein